MKHIVLLGFSLIISSFVYAQCSSAFNAQNGVTGVTPSCNDQTISNRSPYSAITFNVVSGTTYQVKTDNVNWHEEISFFNNGNQAYLGGSNNTNGTSFIWEASFTGTVKAVLTRNNCNTTSPYGWFSGMQSATLTYRLAQGVPADFGSNQWNAYVYDGRDRDLGLGLSYHGFYQESAITYDSRNRWGDGGTPSSASGYQGCAVGVDNHTVVSKRQGFPAGTYYIDVNNHDDEIRLFVNGAEVFENGGCCAFHCNVWNGTLNASSTVEFRHAEGGGGSHQGLNFKPYLINGVNEWNFYAFDGRNRDNLAAITYSGYYTRSSLGLNTFSDYGGSGSPAAASGYIGCDPGVDNHTVVAMRQGFPCDVYALNVTSHDDEASLIVNGSTVWTANCCNFNGVKWTGVLDASSTVEMRYAEGAGGNGMALDVAPVNTPLSGGSISYGGLNPACDGYNPPVFGNTAFPSGGSSAAVNNGSTSYQWQVNGSNISGANSATYDSGPLSVGAYTFRRVATDKCGDSANSNETTITIEAAPAVSISGGGPQAGCNGLDPTLLSATVTGGSGTPSYSWQQRINGGAWNTVSTGASFDPPALATFTFGGTSSFRLVYNQSTLGCADVISNIITFNLSSDPSVLISSGSGTICSGGSFGSLNASASGGTGSQSFQWQQRFNGGAWTNVGFNSSFYSIGTLTTPGTYEYRVQLISSAPACSSPFSSIRTFTVVADPVVSSITGGGPISGCVGLDPTTLTANTLFGTGTATYQWQLNGVDISGATSSTYDPPILNTPGTYAYRVIHGRSGNGCNDATSVAITFTVNGNSTIASSATASSTFICKGDAVGLSLTGGSLGTGATWEWYSDAGLTTNVGTGASIIVNPTTVTRYYVRAEGICNNTATVNTAEVIVNGSSTPPSAAVLPGGSASSICDVNGTDWHYFYNSSGELLAAIRPNGNNLGSTAVDITVGDDGPFGLGLQPNVCGFPSANGGEYALARYWNIEVTNQPTSDVDVKFYYLGADVITLVATIDGQSSEYVSCWGDVNSEADLMMTVEHNGGSKELFTSLAPGAGPGIDIREIQFALGEFSGGKLHASGGVQGANALPVELLSFKATAMGNEYIALDWETATEVNNDGFEVLRSADGINFERVAWVEGNGNSASTREYTYLDFEVAKGITYYYQLKQVDFDGQFEYFDVVSARLEGKDHFFIGNVVPNPSKENQVVRVDIQTASDEAINVRIFNHLGIQVASYSKTLVAGKNDIEMNISDLTAGTYFMYFEGSFGKETRKMVVIK